MDSPYGSSPYEQLGGSPASPFHPSPVFRTQNPLFGKARAVTSILSMRDLNAVANAGNSKSKMLVPTLDLSYQALAVAGTPSRNVGRVQSARTPIVLEESDTQETEEMEHVAMGRHMRSGSMEVRFYEALDDSGAENEHGNNDDDDDDGDGDDAEEEKYVPRPLGESVRQPPMVHSTPIRGPTRGPTAYIPGGGLDENGTFASSMTLSDGLLEQIQRSLEDSIPLQAQRIGRLRTKIACFHGASVVDRIMSNGYAADRGAAQRLAAKLYTNGIIRALQPGGFADSRDRLYRFRPNPLVCDKSTSQKDSEESFSCASTAPAKLITPVRMFSISKILSKNEDWLNTSWTATDDCDDQSATE